MAWSEGGVQQVWGLGVPAWRLPFELVARAVGQPAFPDRLALTAAIGLSVYTVMASLLPVICMTTARQWVHVALTQPERAIAALVLIAFPPVLGLCSGPFNVYEEPVVYGYYYAIGLFASTKAFARKPTPTRYILNGILAGLIGFMRPTFFVYGIATVIAGMSVAQRERWTLLRVCVAPSLLLAGGFALFTSNAHRFGGGFEFGHRLNATGPDIMYASRFGASFSQQPKWRRGLEVLGSLFFVKKFNGADNFQADIVRWQLPTPRWRHFYSRTFDASSLAICISFIALSAWGAFCPRRTVNRTFDFVALIWIAPPCGLLTTFYAIYYPISSRYMLDFAPAMAAAATSLLLLLAARFANSSNIGSWRWLLAAAFALWWALQMALTRNVQPQRAPWGQVHVMDAMRAPRGKVIDLPNRYVLGSAVTPWDTDLDYNGFGWDEHMGRTGPVVMLFVENLAELRIECGSATSGPISPGAIDGIRAKVGLEELRQKSVLTRADCWEIAFYPPVRTSHRKGIQPVFISFVRPDEILAAQSPWRLRRVDWLEATPRRDDRNLDQSGAATTFRQILRD